jgi:ABC-type phosphate transport system substrate-binding protein
MRFLRTLVAGAAVAATAVALTAGPALGDPINSKGKAVTPASFDIVGVGADTSQSLFDQLSVDYNAAHKKHNKSHPRIYSWDATNPKTQAVGDLIRTKSGCAKIARPNGSSAGIATLISNIKDPKGGFCQDFARSSSGRKPTDPPEGKGGILFVALDKDAVTYTTQRTSNAPTNLTTADLTAIYSCTDTTWNEVGGTSHATIKAFLPPSTSGIRTFFLTAIGVTTPGACVNSNPEQNEGTSKLLHSPNAIFPYSVADYIAQRYHSAACHKKPKKGQNEFGCDLHGTLKLNSINGTKPTTGKGAKQTINSGFSPIFVHTIYDVVRYSTSTKDHIPAYLEPFFASAHAKVKGWFCSSKTAKTAIADYGFLPSPLCGLGS